MLLFDTALGTCGIDWSEVGITRVTLPGERCGGHLPPRAVSRSRSGRRSPSIVALLDGEPRDLLEVVLDERGVGDFDRHVYAATRAVRPGATASYGEIARAIGEPDRARIVGAALGRNPFPIIVPCHRILAADGALHGFSAPGGIATKRRMLEIEARSRVHPGSAVRVSRRTGFSRRTSSPADTSSASPLKTRAAIVSIASNSCLIVLKVAAGLITGSVGVLSDAVHSLMDLIASVIALASVRKADEPADASHRYGHEKLEDLSAGAQALLLIVGAAFIAIEAIRRLINGGQRRQGRRSAWPSPAPPRRSTSWCPRTWPGPARRPAPPR